MQPSTGTEMADCPATDTDMDANHTKRCFHECHVHTLTSKVFLNRPIEDLIPVQFIKKAEQTSTVQRKPWIFRAGAEDARNVDLRDWSQVDIRYRGVFRTLTKVPCFEKGLWEGGSEKCQKELDETKPSAQAQVVYALMNEVGTMLELKHTTKDQDAVFFLRPRMLPYQFEYWTGYREKHRDAPPTSGCLSLDFEPNSGASLISILPVSTTLEEEPLISSLEGKFKLLLTQLLIHVRPLPLPGDKLPDQEVFLLGLHGSKMHLMRAFFPGQKISSLWCRREVPGPLPLVREESPEFFSSASSSSSPDTAYATHIEDNCINNHDQSQPEAPRSSTPAGSATAENRIDPASNARTGAYTYKSSRMERFHRKLEQVRLAALDNEPDIRTYRVLATREYDLWLREDFTAAVHILVALQMYLLSGTARCGALQETFREHPIPRRTVSARSTRSKSVTSKNASEKEPESSAESSETDKETYFDSDSELDFEDWDDETPFGSGANEATARLREDVQREERRLAEAEEELRREELIQKREDEDAGRAREAIRVAEGDRIDSLQDGRPRWWDFVWTDDGVGWDGMGVLEGRDPEEDANVEAS